MGKKTDYKRLWRNAQKEGRVVFDLLQTLRGVNAAQIDVLEQVRDGKLKPEDIFKEEKSGK